MSHTLFLCASEFKEFMDNIYEWLPFETDTSTSQRSRKWASHQGNYWYNDGELLDSLQFIPKTKKNDERKKLILDQASMSNVERWFMGNTGNGNRSNQLIKYALMLVDADYSFDDIRTNVLGLNSKLTDPMPEAEVHATIMQTASKAYYRKDRL